MKTVLFLSYAVLAACGNNGAPGTIGDPNGPVAAALTNLTDSDFKQEQPALNSSIAKLSPETQALVQTAYAALEEAIKGLGGSTLKILTVKGEKPELDQATAKRFLEDVHAQLDMLIH
jgi:hypothetical protein